MPKFRGIIPAIITPFDKNGCVFEEGIENEISYLYDAGLENAFICGSYGAFPIMTTRERKLVAERSVQSCKKYNINTIVQIGSTSTLTAIELAKHAEDIGSDAISAVVPFYYSSTIYTEQDFLKYFEKIINSVSIDVHCYNNPRTTGVDISPSLVKKLINLGLKGMKDGGSDMKRMLEVFDAIDKDKHDFDYYPSSTSSLVTGFILGANSCISGVSLSIPTIVLGIYKDVMSRDIDHAVILYKKAMKVRSILGSRGARAITAYDVLNIKGVDVGTCRSPWQRLDSSDADYVIEELRSLEVI